jgi:hypothetical protein
MTQVFATDEDRLAFEKADDIFSCYIDGEANSDQIIYHMWRTCNRHLLERLADYPAADIRPGSRFSGLVMRRELLDDIDVYSYYDR